MRHFDTHLWRDAEMGESMRDRGSIPALSRTDALIALIVGLAGLVLYVRTLAPDVLYGDSAEFQALTYTLGTTHSTGYPIYLLLARLAGFIPYGTLAWRVNLFSALCAAGTLSGVYLMGRSFTENRLGPVLGSLALGLSYTFWFQAVIAEVYTPAMFFLVFTTLLLWYWSGDPAKRNLFLFFAALLSGLGLGVHASAGFIAPAALIFVLWTIWNRRATGLRWRKTLLIAMAGAVLGVAAFVFAFLLIDLHNPVSSFIRVMLYPSRSIWGLTPADLDSPFERLYHTFTGIQWQDAMFSASSTSDNFSLYLDQAQFYEFTVILLVLAIYGLVCMWRSSRQLSVFCFIVYLTSLYFILNYNPPDKYVFYLSTYIWISTAIGVGVGFLMNLARRGSREFTGVAGLAFTFLPLIFFIAMIVSPYGESRWRALREGKASFVKDDYVYPVNDLDEPRGIAGLLLPYIPEDAVVLMEWRDLYSTYYIAHVEQQRIGITLLEAMPHGNKGQIADSLVQELKAAIGEGRLVYSVSEFPGVKENFRILPSGGRLYRLSLP